jgi:hypothetical protein
LKDSLYGDHATGWLDCRNVQADPAAHTTVLDCLEGVMRPKHKADHTTPSTPRSLQSGDLIVVAPCTLSRYVQGHLYLSWLHRQQCHSPVRRCLLSSQPSVKRGVGGEHCWPSSQEQGSPRATEVPASYRAPRRPDAKESGQLS